MKVLAAGVVLLSLAAGQAPPPASSAKPLLEYSGKPLAFPFACTEDDIHWAGLSCSEEEPCPVYLELTAVEGVGNKLFAAGNLHSSSVTLYSVLLASDDGGKTWREGHPRIRGAGLDHIQFVDFENGWISGQALSPLPQDPFLLITGDGGKTWRQRNVFGEGRVGSVLQFRFSSKNNGALIVDRGAGGEGSRYELYESPNAGETWMVRETSDRPLRLKGASTGPQVWRIQTDAATRSYRLERQAQAERWTPAASFLVAAGTCKPAPRKEAPEPAAEPAEPSVPTLVVPTPGRRTPPTLQRKSK